MFYRLAVLSALVLVFLCATSTSQAKHTTLAHKARFVALHGGITGSCYGCATAHMKHLMDRIYSKRFSSAGSYAQAIAKCLMHSESGANPGAISSTGDFGGPQMNYVAHHGSHPDWFQPGRGFKYLIFDPWLGASEMWAMSSGGRSWSPWASTIGGCS